MRARCNGTSRATIRPRTVETTDVSRIVDGAELPGPAPRRTVVVDLEPRGIARSSDTAHVSCSTKSRHRITFRTPWSGPIAGRRAAAWLAFSHASPERRWDCRVSHGAIDSLLSATR